MNDAMRPRSCIGAHDDSNALTAGNRPPWLKPITKRTTIKAYAPPNNAMVGVASVNVAEMISAATTSGLAPTRSHNCPPGIFMITNLMEYFTIMNESCRWKRYTYPAKNALSMNPWTSCDQWNLTPLCCNKRKSHIHGLRWSEVSVRNGTTNKIDLHLIVINDPGHIHIPFEHICRTWILTDTVVRCTRHHHLRQHQWETIRCPDVIGNGQKC